MKRTSSAVLAAKETVRRQLADAGLPEEKQREISASIATFTAAVVRDDRVSRASASMLVKLADVFFNGRPA